MDNRIGFTLERAPSKKPLRWRGPFFLLLLLMFGWGYYTTRPKANISGKYEGFIGYQYGDKTHLDLRIVQQGAELKGDCLLTQQLGRSAIKQTGPLVGTVAADSFKAQATCEKGLIINFDGLYVRKGSQGGPELQGTSYFVTAQGKATDGLPFVGRFVSAWSAPDLLGTRKSK